MRCYYYYYCHLACFTAIGSKGFIPLSYGYPTPSTTAVITQKNKTSRNTTSSFALIGNTKLRNRNISISKKLSLVGGSSRSSVTDSQEDSRKYFLLNSKRIWRQIIFNTIILFVMKYVITRLISPVASSCCNRYDISFSFMKHSSDINVLSSRTAFTTAIVKAFTDLFLPLMSSACCAIQLILNSIGVGCAGFNTVLGPLRPYFVATLIFKSIEMFTSTQTIHIVKFTSAWFLALLPEFIHFMNNRRASKVRVLLNDECYYSNDAKRILVTLNIPSMGCVACINKIDATIQNLEHVINGSSRLNNIGKGGIGTVLLECSNDTNVGTITQKLVQSVTDAGFPCEIDSISMQE